MDKVRFAILGAGAIADTMAATVSRMTTVESYAVASRDIGRSKAMADRHGFSVAYGSYEELLADPRVDLVYIATPHNFHAGQALMCLEAEKHILCEKPFAVNAREAARVLRLARKKGLLAADAMWPRYSPLLPVLGELLRGGTVGEARMLTANLGSPIFDRRRLWDPALAGGALLDLGVYTLTFAAVVMGLDIQDFTASADMGDTGVDRQNAITLRYPDGRLASLHNTATAAVDELGMIYCTKGRVEVEGMNYYRRMRVYNVDGELIASREFPCAITGYEYEVQACVDAIAAGACECAQYGHNEILKVMELMDSIRDGWGLSYPGEK